MNFLNVSLALGAAAVGDLGNSLTTETATQTVGIEAVDASDRSKW